MGTVASGRLKKHIERDYRRGLRNSRRTPAADTAIGGNRASKLGQLADVGRNLHSRIEAVQPSALAAGRLGWHLDTYCSHAAEALRLQRRFSCWQDGCQRLGKSTVVSSVTPGHYPPVCTQRIL
jgi:hypothetical protein